MDDIGTLILDILQWPSTQAILLIFGSIVAAKIVDIVVSRAVLRLVKHTATTLDDQIVACLHRPIFTSVVLFGLAMATGVLGLPEVYSAVVYGGIKTVALVLWSTALFRLSRMVVKDLERPGVKTRWIEKRTLPLLDNLIKMGLVAGVVYGLLKAWNLDVTPWLASAGILGIAIGFAAKDTLANLFGGLFVIADAPYKIGDYIVLDTGERGRVTNIGLRSTRLLTRDDIEVIVPNAQIAAAKIVNESGGPYEKARVTVVVGVAYGSDVDEVRRVLLAAADSVELVTQDPPARVRFTEFGDSSLVFRLLAWVERPERRGACVDALHVAVYKALNREQIEIPFPQRVVHMVASPAAPPGA